MSDGNCSHPQNPARVRSRWSLRKGIREEGAWSAPAPPHTHKLVWFPSGTSREDALRRAATIPVACGLWFNGPDIALRVPHIHHNAVVEAIRGKEEASRLSMPKYKVAGVPPAWCKSDVVDMLQGRGWECGVEDSRWDPVNRSRTWYVRASVGPPRDRIPTAEGLIFISLWEPEEDRPPPARGPARTTVRVWEPPRDRTSVPSQVPKTWAERIRESTPSQLAPTQLVRTHLIPPEGRPVPEDDAHMHSGEGGGEPPPGAGVGLTPSPSPIPAAQPTPAGAAPSLTQAGTPPFVSPTQNVDPPGDATQREAAILQSVRNREEAMMQSMRSMMEDMMRTVVTKIDTELAPLKSTVRQLKEAQEFGEQMEKSAEEHAAKFARVSGSNGMGA